VICCTSKWRRVFELRLIALISHRQYKRLLFTSIALYAIAQCDAVRVFVSQRREPRRRRFIDVQQRQYAVDATTHRRQAVLQRDRRSTSLRACPLTSVKRSVVAHVIFVKGFFTMHKRGAMVCAQPCNERVSVMYPLNVHDSELISIACHNLLIRRRRLIKANSESK
jgi:hypothetical protein